MIRSTRGRRHVALLALGALSVGTVGITAGSADAKPEFALTRIAGNTRAATAALLATDTFSSGADLAIIVREDAFPDALAGNYLAGQFNAPILLATTTGVSAETLDALQTLGTDAVTLLGGTTALGPGVEAAIKARFPNMAISRIAGPTRTDTAERIALAPAIVQPPKAVGQINGENVAVVSSANNFPDALSAGPMVFSQHFPQLLTDPNAVSAGLVDTLNTLQIDRILLTGGTTAISANVENALKTAGFTVDRIFGNTRYQTSQQLAVFEGTNFGYSAAHLNFSTGVNFPDALAGGPHAGAEKAAIILTPPSTTDPDFAGLCSALGQLSTSLTSADVFGGTVAVPDAVVASLTDCGKGTAPAAGTGQIVSVNVGTNTYQFVQTSDNKVITVTYDGDDTFTVGGQSSTLDNFENHITVGDTITFTDDTTAANKDTHALTDNVVTSGLVGDVDITGNTFSIINPVTGTRVGGPFTYNEASDNLGGTPAAFEGRISEGDTVSVAEDATTHVKTITLTDANVQGTVTDTSDSFGPNKVGIVVNGVLGDQFDSNGVDDNFFVAEGTPAVGTESYTIGGAAKTYAEFAAAVSVGDTITYSRTGNAETYALVNAAPPTDTGQAIDDLDTAADTFSFVTEDGTVIDVDYTGIANITVGTQTATAADLETHYSAGDTITFQAADAASSTNASLKLVDAPLQGQIADIDIPNHTVDILSVNNHVALVDDLDYEAGLSPLYYVNGTDPAHEVDLATFNDKLQDVLDTNTATPTDLDDLLQVVEVPQHLQFILSTDDT